MKTTKAKTQIIVNNVFLVSLLLLFIYSLGFVIRVNNHSLISNYLGFSLPSIINIVLCLILVVLSIATLFFNKDKINPKLSIIFGAVGVIYTIYLVLYGYFISKEELSIIFGNVKNIWMMCLLAFIALIILPRILTKKQVNFAMYFIMLLAFASIIYFCIKDLPTAIKNFLVKNPQWAAKSFYTNKNIYGFGLFFAVVASLYLMGFKHKIRYFFVSLFYFGFILLSFAKTAAVCSIIVYIIVLAHMILKIKKKWLKITIISLIAFILIFGGLVLGDVITFIPVPNNIKEYIAKIVYSSHTFSSRIQEFAKSFAGMNYKNIFLGVGFTSGLNLIKEFTGYSGFHTSYNENIICGGIVLTLLKLFALIYIVKGIRSTKHKNKDAYITLVAGFTAYMFYTLCESVLLFNWEFLSFSITLLVCVVPLTAMYNNNLIGALKFNNNEHKVVAFITTIYPDNDKKWYGIYLHDLAKSMQNLGYEINVIKITQYKKEDEVYEGIKIHYIKLKNSWLHKLMLPIGFNFKLSFKALLKTKKYDTAIIHFYPVAMQNVIIDELHEENVKVIHYLHSRNVFRRIDEKHVLYRKLYLNQFYKAAYKKCDEIVCVSNLVKNDLLAKMKKYKHAHVIYNGVSNIFIQAKQNKFISKDNNFNLISIGNMYSIKGHKYVLEALNIIKKELPNINFKWTIVGQGNEYNEIVNKIKEYNLVNNVKIIKELTQPQVLEHLKKNDIFIMPSYYEGLGIVYLEAMNLGLITIGCTNQGISELFDSFTMQFVDEKEVDQIVLLLKSIFTNYKAYEVLTKNAKNASKKYTWDLASRQLSELL